MGILKEGFSAYSSPVMLISRKLTKDKRVVTDFRHLNARIAKTWHTHWSETPSQHWEAQSARYYPYEI